MGAELEAERKRLASHLEKPGPGYNWRSERQYLELLPKVSTLRAAGHRVRLLFLDAADAALAKRYDATRRKHPLDGEAAGLVEAIELERGLLEEEGIFVHTLAMVPSLNRHHDAVLERVVRHCLEKNPEERFPTARDFAGALDLGGFERLHGCRHCLSLQAFAEHLMRREHSTDSHSGELM